jgi:hypothetical protein
MAGVSTAISKDATDKEEGGFGEIGRISEEFIIEAGLSSGCPIVEGCSLCDGSVGLL